MKTEFFARTTQAYYGEMTFLEAFQRTGRVVNIVCTRSKEYSTQPIVLNYINTPHVYIWCVGGALCERVRISFVGLIWLPHKCVASVAPEIGSPEMLRSDVIAQLHQHPARVHLVCWGCFPPSRSLLPL